MSGYTQERRRQVVVNTPMQSRLILSMALMPAIALAAIAVFTALYCSRAMEEAYANDSELPNLSPLFYLVIAFELVAALFLMVNSLRFSHRVAGPAYRICKSLERIRSGDLAFTVHLRKGDHLVEIRDELNRLLDWLNQNPPPNCITRTMAAEQGANAATSAAPTPPGTEAVAATAASTPGEAEPTTRAGHGA